MKNLIGRKAKGFWFESGKHKALYYAEIMDKQIGEVGEITSYRADYDCYHIDFKGDSWDYPASEIEAHLVDECDCEKEIDKSTLKPRLKLPMAIIINSGEKIDLTKDVQKQIDELLESGRAQELVYNEKTSYERKTPRN